MFDVGWTELLVIGVLALIVVGPRDLPQLLRTVGQWVGKIKRMAREFQRTMEDAAREADVTDFKELRDLKKEMSSLDLRQQATKARSYLNKPVKPDSKEASTAAKAESASEDASETAKAAADPSPADAGGEAAPASSSGDSSAEKAPAGAEGASVEDSSMAFSDDAGPGQAGAKG